MSDVMVSTGYMEDNIEGSERARLNTKSAKP